MSLFYPKFLHTMCDSTEEWCIICRKSASLFSQKYKGLDQFHVSHGKILKWFVLFLFYNTSAETFRGATLLHST